MNSNNFTLSPDVPPIHTFEEIPLKDSAGNVGTITRMRVDGGWIYMSVGWSQPIFVRDVSRNYGDYQITNFLYDEVVSPKVDIEEAETLDFSLEDDSSVLGGIPNEITDDASTVRPGGVESLMDDLGVITSESSSSPSWIETSATPNRTGAQHHEGKPMRDFITDFLQLPMRLQHEIFVRMDRRFPKLLVRQNSEETDENFFRRFFTAISQNGLTREFIEEFTVIMYCEDHR